MKPKVSLAIILTLVSLAACGSSQDESDPGEVDGYPFSQMAPLKAAPSLQGYGSETAAGRGGRVLIISNLNDSGAGSARAALEAEGPRQIISSVAGEILLSSPIDVASDCSFYGQVAPLAGLTFTMDHPDYLDGAIVVEDSADVLLQYIRVRGVGGGVHRNLIVQNSERVVVDHGSFSWSTDQNLNSWYVNTDLTFSNNMSYEGLGADEGVAKPTLFGHSGSKRLSLHHNVLAHGIARMPKVSNVDDFGVDWNVIYNPGNWGTQVDTQSGLSTPIRGNITNNWFLRTQNENPAGGEVELKGNDGRVDAYLENNFLKNSESFVAESNSSENYTISDARFDGAVIVDQATVQELPETLLSHAGASLPLRDANDARIISEIETRQGALVNDIRGNGGTSQTFVPPTASAECNKIDPETVDGVPDSWKVARGIPAGSDLTQRDSNQDGYTDWEDWRLSEFDLADRSSNPCGEPRDF